MFSSLRSVRTTTRRFFSLVLSTPLHHPSTFLLLCQTTSILRRYCTDMSSAKKSKAVVTDTALHIIKGAVVKVLNTPLTISTEAKSATKGRLVVQFTSSDKPTEAQINEIQNLTNQKISENVPIETLTIDRKQAEEHYSKNRVNNTYIYDNFPVRDSITELTLVHIPDWNINCCPSQHCKTTGEVGGIKITGVNHRPPKNELEFVFDILSALPTSSSSSSSSSSSTPVPSSSKAAKGGNKSAPAAPVVAGPAPDDVAHVTQQILKLALSESGKEGVDAADREKIVAAKVEALLVSLKNTAYTNGMRAAKSQLK